MEEPRTALLSDDAATSPIRTHVAIVAISAIAVAAVLDGHTSRAALGWWLAAVWFGAGTHLLAVTLQPRTSSVWWSALQTTYLGATAFTGLAWASLLIFGATERASIHAIVLLGAVAPTASALLAHGHRRGTSPLFLTSLWGSATLVMIGQSQLDVAVLTTTTWIATLVAARSTSTLHERASSDRRARLELQRELATARATDPITGLLDRRSTLASIRRSMDAGHALGLLCIDLDDFGAVNDRFGHAAGDQVLINVALRLAEITRPDDVVGRIGNDEFVVVLTDPADLFLTDVIADRVAGEIARSHGPIAELSITASVGSVISVDGLSAEDLLGCADTAMARAKQNGGNTAETFLARNSL